MAAAAKRPLAQRYPSVFSSSPHSRSGRTAPRDFAAPNINHDASSSSAPHYVPLFRDPAPLSPIPHSPNPNKSARLNNSLSSCPVHRADDHVKSPAKLPPAADHVSNSSDPFGFFAAQRRLQSTRAESAVEVEARGVDRALTIYSPSRRTVFAAHDMNRTSSSPSKDRSPLKKRPHYEISEPEFDEARASSTPRAVRKKTEASTASSVPRLGEAIEETSSSDSSPAKPIARPKRSSTKHRTTNKLKPRAAARKARKVSVEPECSVDEEKEREKRIAYFRTVDEYQLATEDIYLI